MTQNEVLSEQELKAIPTVCVLAAMADGSQSALEKNEIRRLANRFSSAEFDLNASLLAAHSGGASVSSIAGQIHSDEGKQLAYEMAVCICSVDNALNEAEKKFLSELHGALGLDITKTQPFVADAARFSSPALEQPPKLGGTSYSTPPSSSTTPPTLAASEVDQIILNRAILAGALEIMPQNLATMAIIPVQMQLVYQIGKKHGFDLSLSSTKEFLATIGIGMTSQVLESYVTRFVRGTASKFAGKLVGGLLTQATEAAISFATTYAIGHAANKYYASGRTISMGQVKDVFSETLNQGRTLKSQYASQITQRASQLSATDLLNMVRN